jgi:DNA polymerase-3 subunit delta'
MQFKDVIGHHHLKDHFIATISKGRIPHAQLFVGKTGSGILPMALAYARELLGSNHPDGSPEQLQTYREVDAMVHPDLHFSFPIYAKDDRKKVSSAFLDQWRSFVIANPYASLYDWLQELEIGNSQALIYVNEAVEISKSLSLKSFKGGHKVLIMWLAEKMHESLSNKILKLIEEPPDGSVLLLLTENEEQILTTIHSRCQRSHFSFLPEAAISKHLQDYEGADPNTADKLAHRANGDFNQALHMLSNNADDLQFERWFVDWVRMAFRGRRQRSAVIELLEWSDQLAGQGRETQKKFLHYCIEMFRQALLKNYGLAQMVYFEPQDAKFDLAKFAPFVHQNNIYEIITALENAILHIGRNANARIVLSDLSIQLTRLIHKKELA